MMHKLSCVFLVFFYVSFVYSWDKKLGNKKHFPEVSLVYELPPKVARQIFMNDIIKNLKTLTDIKKQVIFESFGASFLNGQENYNGLREKINLNLGDNIENFANLLKFIQQGFSDENFSFIFNFVFMPSIDK